MWTPQSFSKSLPFLLLLSAFSHTAHAATSNPIINITFPESPSASASQNVVLDNFLGISFELAPFNLIWGNTTETMPNAMKNYLGNIRARLTHPLRIRIGGNSMDSSTYVSSQPEMITLPDPNAYFNDVPVDFGPTFFDVLNAMADDIGSMQYIIGLSMQDPSSDSNVIELAAAAESMLGDRLDAMLLGNEPDLYAGHGTRANYTIQDYIPEIGGVLNDLQNSSYGNLINTTIIGGPTVCCQWNLSDVLEAGLSQYPYKYYTIQHYPLSACSGPDAQNTNISYFLSHSNVNTFMTFNAAGINMGKQSGVPVLLTEYNSVSCGGTNISDTFATSLWAVDVGLQAAVTNLSGAFLHTREWGVEYNLFDPPTPYTATDPEWSTGSTYYSALFLSETFSPNGSIVVDLNVNNSLTNPSASVAAYGVYDQGVNGTARSKLVFINYAQGGSQQFQIPPNTTYAVQYRSLLAPNVAAANASISWAGQTVGEDGMLQGTQNTTRVSCKDGCAIEVPGPGAVLLIMYPSPSGARFYEGNSTVAGYGYQKSGGAVGGGALMSSWISGWALLSVVLSCFGFYC